MRGIEEGFLLALLGWVGGVVHVCGVFNVIRYVVRGVGSWMKGVELLRQVVLSENMSFVLCCLGVVMSTLVWAHWRSGVSVVMGDEGLFHCETTLYL